MERYLGIMVQIYARTKSFRHWKFVYFFKSELVDIDLVTVGVYDNAHHFKQIIDTVRNCQKIQLPNIKSDDLHLIDQENGIFDI